MPKNTDANGISEWDIRHWFVTVDLEQAKDTFRVVEGILQVRREAQPKRKTRSDAGKKRDENGNIFQNNTGSPIDLREITK